MPRLPPVMKTLFVMVKPQFIAHLLASLWEGGAPKGRRERALPWPEIFRMTARLSPPPPAGGAPSQRGPRKKALFLFAFFPQHHKKILQQGLRLVLQQARFYDRMVVERQGEQIGQAAAAARLGVACAVDDPL